MIKLVCIALFALGINEAKIAAPREQNTIEQRLVPLDEYVKRLKTFSCKIPQLRTVLVRDLIEHPNPDVDYFPPATILGRCDKYSGCNCPEGYDCGPKNWDLVQLYITDKHVSDHSTEYEIVPAKNHTECHCMLNTV